MFSVYPSPLWWLREYMLCLIMIIKSDIWTIAHCLGLGHETMVCAVCLYILNDIRLRPQYDSIRYNDTHKITPSWASFVVRIVSFGSDLYIYFCCCCANNVCVCVFMMTSSNGNRFRVTGPLWWESTGHRWIPLKKASDGELWYFLWSVPEKTVEQTIRTPVIWDATTPKFDFCSTVTVVVLNAKIVLYWTVIYRNQNVHNRWVWYWPNSPWVIQVLSARHFLYINSPRVRWIYYHRLSKVNIFPCGDNDRVG